eukprot:1156662-Pelagomonas_calceolata.AAC.24
MTLAQRSCESPPPQSYRTGLAGTWRVTGSTWLQSLGVRSTLVNCHHSNGSKSVIQSFAITSVEANSNIQSFTITGIYTTI